MMLALTMVWAWISVSPNSLQAQTPSLPQSEYPVFIDSKGDSIPYHPNLLPYKMVNGYPEYKIGPGDILEMIIIEGPDKKTENIRVRPDGTVSFSVVNNVQIADLTLSEATDKMTEALKVYVRAPQLQVFMKEYNSRSASLFGSINLRASSDVAGSTANGPGIYALKRRITALEFIMLAGGPTADARLDQARLTRENRTYSINLQIAVTQGDNRQNVILQHGDVLQLTGTQQADRRVAILGEVNQAGVANLSSQSNMLEAIAAAQGFSVQAAPNRIRVIRTTDPNNPTIITVNANRIFKGDLSQNIGLQDGDIIVVPRAYGYELSEILTEISPIINFGGLISTAPAATLSGYSWNLPGQNNTATTTSANAAAAEALSGASTTSSLATQQQLINQIQRNLQKTADEKQ